MVYDIHVFFSRYQRKHQICLSHDNKLELKPTKKGHSNFKKKERNNNNLIVSKCIMLFLFNKGCNEPDKYGNGCDKPCPINCKNNTCHIVYGACFGCKPGWTGTSCSTSINLFLIKGF